MDPVNASFIRPTPWIDGTRLDKLDGCNLLSCLSKKNQKKKKNRKKEIVLYWSGGCCLFFLSSSARHDHVS